jgi:hypothetical protein
MSRVLFTLNSFHKAKHSTKLITWKYRSGYVKLCIEKGLNLGPTNDWILHNDKAPAHKALSVKQFLAQKSITEIEHPPYSSDLPPKDLWLLPKIKSA